MRRLTASRFALAQKCSYQLHEHVEHEDNFPREEAEDGTAVHAFIEADIKNENLPIHLVANLPKERVDVIMRKYESWSRWADTNRRIGWQSEVPLAYHARSDVARALESKGHRDYSGARDGEVCMTLDLVCFGEDMDGTYGVVKDWKTGQDSAYASAQLALGALAWARLHGIDRVHVSAVYLGEESVREVPGWLSSFDLDMVRGDVLRILERPDQEPRPGTHCATHYCPARASCPATMRAMAEVAQTSPADIVTLAASAITTPAQAGAAYARLRVVKDGVKAIEERIKTVVREQGPAPTVAGKELRLVETSRETFSRSRLPKESAEATLQELRDLGALTMSTSEYLREEKVAR